MAANQKKVKETLAKLNENRLQAKIEQAKKLANRVLDIDIALYSNEIKMLIAGLGSSDVDTANLAYYELVKLAQDKSLEKNLWPFVDDLLKTTNSKDPTRPYSIAYMLYLLSTPNLEQYMIEMLKSTTNKNTKITLLLAFAERKTKLALPVAIKILNESNDADINNVLMEFFEDFDIVTWKKTDREIIEQAETLMSSVTEQ